jgi:hypothetical protein
VSEPVARQVVSARRDVAGEVHRTADGLLMDYQLDGLHLSLESGHVVH